MKINTLKKLLAIVAIACGVVAFCLMFAPALTSGGDNPTVYAGNIIAFGKTYDSATWFGVKGTLHIMFSFGALIAYVLPLAAAIVLACGVFMKKKAPSFIFGAIAFACFVVTFILMLSVKNMTSYEVFVSSSDSKVVLTSGTFAQADYKLAVGLIIASVLSAVGACLAGSFTVLNLLKTKNSKKRKK